MRRKISALPSPSKSPVPATFQFRSRNQEDCLGSGEVGPIHQPDRVASGHRVTPQNVGLSIAVGITDTDNVLIEIADDVADHLAGGKVRALHEPYHHLPSQAVVPQDIVCAISIEAARADNFPVNVTDGRNRGGL